MRKMLVLSFVVFVTFLSLPSTMPSQPPPDQPSQRPSQSPPKLRQGTLDQERIEWLKERNDELLALQREMNGRRLLEAVRKQQPNADLRKIRKQYGIPARSVLRDLSEDEIKERWREIQGQIQTTIPEEELQQIRPLYYDGVDVMDVSENPPEPSREGVDLWVRDENILKVAKSVVAIVKTRSLTSTGDGGWSLKVGLLKTVDGDPLCNNERWFGREVTQVVGTGFLVGDDVVATAGHVASDPAFLDSVRFVFGYVMEDGEHVKTVYTGDDIYKGVEVKGGFYTQPDWALVRLHTKVKGDGRVPLKCRMEDKVPDPSRVYMIGHPDGLPQQYSWNAEVCDNSDCSYFYATLDVRTYNSGSPVINADSSAAGRPIVEGILVRDKPSWEEVCECVYLREYTEQLGRPGATVTRATEFSRVIEKKDSVLVKCELPCDRPDDCVGTVVLKSSGTSVYWTIAPGDERYLPWADYYYLPVPGLTCELAYTPVPGSVWEIVEGDIPDIRVPSMTLMKMQKVCCP